MSDVLFTAENFAVSGNSYEEFKKLILDLSAHTRVKKIQTETTRFLFPIYYGKQEPAADGTVIVQRMDHQAMEDEILCKKPELQRLKKKAFPEDLFNEWYYQNLPLIQPNGEPLTFFVSSYAMPTFCQVARVGGDDTVNSGNIYRNKHLAYAFTGKKGRDAQIVYREELRREIATPIRKIISVNSGTYGYVPQSVVCDIIEGIVADGVVGKFDVSGWSVDQEFTKIIITFPEIQKDFDDTYKLPTSLIPGLLIQTSDAAQSSLTVRGVMLHSKAKTYIPMQEKSMKHTSNNAAGVKKFIAGCEADIFPEFRKLPEALAKAISMDIGDPKADLTNPAKAEKNKDAVSELILSMTNSMVGGKSRVSKGLAKDLHEALMAEINPGVHYTRYDIAMMFLGLPDRIDSKDSIKTSLVHECSLIPYKIIAEKKEKVSKKLTLLPA